MLEIVRGKAVLRWLPVVALSALLLAAFALRMELLYGGGVAVVAFGLLSWYRPRWAVLLLLVAMPLAPKISLPFGNLYIATVLVMVFVGVWAVRKLVSPGEVRLARTRLSLPVFLYAAVLLLSTVMSAGYLIANREQLLRLVQFFFYLSLFFVVSDTSIDPGFRRRVVLLVVGTGILEGVIACFQWFTRVGFFTTGTFDREHNHLSAYLVFTGLLLVGVMAEVRSRKAIAALLAGFVAMGIGLAFSFSRTGYVAVAAGMVLFAFLGISWKKRLAVLLLLAAGAIAAYQLVPESVAERFGTIVVVAAGKTKTDISFTTRLMMWRDAIDAFRSSPLIGVGAMRIPITDNYFVKTLGETGLLGMASLLWLIAAILREGLRAFRSVSGDALVRGARLGLVPAAFALLVVFNGLGDFFGVHRLMGVFWILLAVLLPRADLPEDGPVGREIGLSK